MNFCSNCGARLERPPPIKCSVCQSEHFTDAKPCAAALITHEGRLLLAKRATEPWRGYWDVPAGFCGPNEHPIITAEREVLEETGIGVNVVGFAGIWLGPYTDLDGKGDPTKTCMNVYYFAEPIFGFESNPNPDEVLEIQWFLPESLPDDVSFPEKNRPALEVWRRWLEGEISSHGIIDKP